MQVADLIGEIGDLHLINYLKILANDKINYVQRSALIALSKIIPDEAEEIAYTKIGDKDAYIRLFSLKLLKKLSSTKLPKVVEILKNDESKFIQEELKAIL
jgi:HEAT repeat protein